MADQSKDETVGMTIDGEAAAKSKRQRSITIGLSILGFVVLVYLVTILRLGASVAERSF